MQTYHSTFEVANLTIFIVQLDVIVSLFFLYFSVFYMFENIITYFSIVFFVMIKHFHIRLRRTNSISRNLSLCNF